MNKPVSQELPLLTEFLNTVNLIGSEATNKALINARNKVITLEGDKIAGQIINAILVELAISFDHLVSYETRTTKKRHGLIIASYCLTELKYKQMIIGTILGGRKRQQIYEYDKIMRTTPKGRIAEYKNKFDILLKPLIKKQKK